MAHINLFRGGTADFKPAFCRGDFAEFMPPFGNAPMDDTPPYNSHACGAYGQGWLNLQFPLVPNLQRNDAHKWQRIALDKLAQVGDNIRLAWVPLRSFVLAQHFEVSRTDSMLDGVYVKPIAERVSYDFTAKEWVWEEVTEYATAVGNAGITQFPLGTPSGGDKRWGVIDFTKTTEPIPCTFGHDLVVYDAKGRPTGGLDDKFGFVVLGLQISAGDESKIANLWRSNIAVYMSAKLCQFECGTQVG